MIDIHSHIIFDIDDGPKSLEDSIKMLINATTEGITEIIFTSHAFHPLYHANAKTVKERLNILQHGLEVHNIPLKLQAGHEVRINEHICRQIDEGSALTLANSKYLLIELPSYGMPKYTFEIVNQLKAKNIVPIIAHPERNKGITERPELLEQLIRQGALSQITAGSVIGHFGKSIQRTALSLIDANLVHTYGSDVHNLKTRPFLFDKGLTYLEKHKRPNFVDFCLENNRRIIANREIIAFEPMDIGKKKWWNFFISK
ncbi:tyrosine-protein phosphatase [Rummeliibacillus pycnus]|uniref:tyrosine-protein phosphatase n=1 Tax=Rummeliibacillus pycnus TaxID=101070 RepID=UPI000C9B397A|nr:CpsB/CapC family capsule biosynthesis tyrosine phosphatase [Rummeliibacillus pycnus]